MKALSIFKETKYSFDGKKDYEEVLVLLYRHWFTLFITMVAFGLMLLLPVVVYWLVNRYAPSLDIGPFLNLFTIIYLLVWWLSLFYRVTMYLLDTWIVTDHRILDNEQKGFFSRLVSEMHIDRVQDVSVKVQGFIPTLLDYGDIEIQTAGTEEKFIFKQVPHPNAVRELIMKAHSRFISVHPGNIEIHEPQS